MLFINIFQSLCVNGGNGGDGPENDLEAVIAGINQYTTSRMSVEPKGKVSGGSFERIVLVVDGDSPVRDISLLNQIKSDT